MTSLYTSFSYRSAYLSTCVFGYSEPQQEIISNLTNGLTAGSENFNGAVSRALQRENFPYLFYDLSASLKKLENPQLTELLSYLFNTSENTELLLSHLQQLFSSDELEKIFDLSCSERAVPIAKCVAPIQSNKNQALQESLIRGTFNYLVECTDEVIEGLLSKIPQDSGPSTYNGRYQEPSTQFNISSIQNNNPNVRNIILHLKTAFKTAILWVSFISPKIIENKSIAFICAVALQISLSIFYTLYCKYLKPKNSQSRSYAVSMVQKASRGEYSRVVGRDYEINQIVEHLMAKKQGKVSRHLLLCGVSGVGKTEIMKGFARKIANKEVPTELLGFDVLEVDMSKISSMDGLIYHLKDYPDTVLFLDEIQATNDYLKPQLLKFLDNSPYIVAATTTAESNAIIKNQTGGALFRRLEELSVGSLSEAATLSLLTEAVLAEDRLVIDPRAIAKAACLQKRLPLAPQPFTSMDIFSRACQIVHARAGASTDQQKSLKERFEERERLQSMQTLELRNTGKINQELDESLSKLDSEIATLKSQILIQKSGAIQLEKVADQWSRYRTEMELLSMKISKGTASNLDRSRFTLLYSGLLPALQHKIQTVREAAESPLAITEDLIEELIQREEARAAQIGQNSSLASQNQQGSDVIISSDESDSDTD